MGGSLPDLTIGRSCYSQWAQPKRPWSVVGAYMIGCPEPKESRALRPRSGARGPWNSARRSIRHYRDEVENGGRGLAWKSDAFTLGAAAIETEAATRGIKTILARSERPIAAARRACVPYTAWQEGRGSIGARCRHAADHVSSRVTRLSEVHTVRFKEKRQSKSCWIMTASMGRSAARWSSALPGAPRHRRPMRNRTGSAGARTYSVKREINRAGRRELYRNVCSALQHDGWP